MKVFISYSHKDESYKDQLDTQLSILKRNKVIRTWNDRDIVSGQDWKNEIDINLESSEIVILLVSSDFLDSDYCYEKEMRRAIEKHDEKSSIVVPIIVRPCDWKETPFGKIQASPTDAKAISIWEDNDEAWLDVIAKLKDTINLARQLNVKKAIQEALWTDIVLQDFYRWLNDTEIELSHRRISKVQLDDVFVAPDLKALDNDLDHISKTISATDLISAHNLSLIFGDEQSGKTSLSKHYFKELLKRGYHPIYIQGDEIKSANINDLVTAKASEQYSSDLSYESVENKVIIIDNFSNTKLNRKYQNKLVINIKDQFDKVIILSIDSFQYVAPEIEELDDFDGFEILNFGNVKRTELIEKWVSMGVVEEIDEKDLYADIDEIKLKVEAMTRGNILPPKPIYILTLLQMFESITPQKVDLTSYGHCYQYLIYQALEKVRIKNSEIDMYINFLTEFGCAQFNNNGSGLDVKQLAIFHSDYEEKYLSVDIKRIVDTLIRSGILILKHDLVSFKYSYIYYFFTAKKLAESFSNDASVKSNIKLLLDNLHREDCANIIIFITHHSKDDWVLDEIQVCLMELFDEYAEADLKRDSLEFMSDFLNEIPELVIEHKKIDEERIRHDAELDRIEENEKKHNEKNDGLEPTDILAKINKTFKGIEIIGQIIRNRHGSLSKEKLEQLAEQAYGVGLRFLQFFLDISDSSKEEVVKSIEHILKENPNIDNDKLEKEARNVFLLMTYGAIYGVLRKISSSIGSKEAEQIYKKIEHSLPSPAVKLINQAIYLQFNKKLDVKALKMLTDEFDNNPTCNRILKEIVIQHIYMFPVDYKQKQQISELLDIPVANQIYLGSQKSFNM